MRCYESKLGQNCQKGVVLEVNGGGGADETNKK